MLPIAFTVAFAGLASAQPMPIKLVRAPTKDPDAWVCTIDEEAKEAPRRLALPSAERVQRRMARFSESMGAGTRAGAGSEASGGKGKDPSSALNRTFDNSSGSSSQSIEANYGASLPPSSPRPSSRAALVPVAANYDAPTEKVLDTLSPWQKSIAKKAIPIIDKMGEKLGLYSLLQSMGVNEPRLFVLSLINAESGFNPTVTSKAGAVGLMQVLPGTANMMAAGSGSRLKDVETNVKAGMSFLNYSLRELGRPDYALAGYNAGVDGTRHSLSTRGKIPQIPETIAYVKTIFTTYTRWLGDKWNAFSDGRLASLY
jgi:soluble lytic murein transglycosylase-like protein